ncbi:MAG: haloacid dehalogenase [Frankiales bacterium]|nr:haloacid dehalogenase [Frankiales bacterium]
MSAPARGQGLGWCDEPLCSAYDAALYDLDGVLYLGTEVVEHAAQGVAAAVEAGMRAAFVTNNASRRTAVVAAHLTELGIPARAEDVVTSAQVAARRLAEQLPPGAPVLVVGTEALAEEIAAAGLRPVRSAQERPVGVAQGLAPETAWTDLAEAAVAINAGAVWVTGNVDSTYPTPRGNLPGNGAMVAALELATGRTPEVTGKPQPTLQRESASRLGARRPLVVGDRLDSDVLGAVRAGFDSLLVLTGVVDREHLLAAPAGSRPTYVAADLRALLRPQPAVVFDGDRARCADAVATWNGGELSVQGSGDDALRAACALAWARADA